MELNTIRGPSRTFFMFLHHEILQSFSIIIHAFAMEIEIRNEIKRRKVKERNFHRG